MAWRVSHQLNYQWQWHRLLDYLVVRDSITGQWRANYLLQGLLTTLRLSIYSGLLALGLGIVLALARGSQSLFLRLSARTYVELMRNLPPLVIVFLVYFFLAGQISPLTGLDEWARGLSPQGQQWLQLLVARPEDLAPYLSAVATLGIFEGAYFAEIIRAGIEAVPVSQYQAAQALGLTHGQILVHVIFPQALRQVLPPLAGQFISLVKDSSIVSVISIQELTYQGSQLMASTYMTIEAWTMVAGLYLLLTLPCSLVVDLLERRRQGVTV